MGEDCKCGDDCGCGHEHGKVSIEEIVYNNNVILNTLINIMIEKKMITEEELMKKLDESEADGSEDTEEPSEEEKEE